MLKYSTWSKHYFSSKLFLDRFCSDKSTIYSNKTQEPGNAIELLSRLKKKKAQNNQPLKTNSDTFPPSFFDFSMTPSSLCVDLNKTAKWPHLFSLTSWNHQLW